MNTTHPPAEPKELWRLEQLALLSQIATQVTSILDLDELLLRVSGLIHQTFHFYAVSIYTLEKGVLRLRAEAGPGGPFRAEDAFIPPQHAEIRLGEGIVGWVAEHQQEVVAGDVSQESRFRYSPEFPATRAEAALPLKLENKLLGVLDVQLDTAEHFDDTDLLVLRAVAGQVSMAIEDTRLYAEAHRRGDYLATIGAVSAAIASILDVDQLLERVSQLIRSYFNYPFVQIFTVHYARRQIEHRASSDVLARGVKPKGLTFALDDPQGIIPSVARTGQTSLLSDVSMAPAYRPSSITTLATRSELTVPLIYNNEVLGILDVQSDQAGAFGPQDQTLLETLAAHIAVALRNANLYHSERWRHQVAESLRLISGALLTDVNLTNILNTILVELKRNLPADHLAIWLIRNDKLQLIAVQPPTTVQFATNFEPAQDPWLALGLTAAEPLIRQPHHPPDPLAARLGYSADHSAIVAPLRVSEQRRGLLTLAHANSDQYGREAGAITSAFANQAAIAIENARLFRRAQDEAQINSALLKVAEATQSFGDLGNVLTEIVRIPPLIAGVERCALWVRSEKDNNFEPRAIFGFEANATDFFYHYPLASDSPLVDLLRQSGVAQVITAAPASPHLPNDLTTQLTLSTVVLVPLIAHGDLLGVLLVTFTTPTAIRKDSIHLLTGIAYQAAVAVESKSLYDRKAAQERLAYELKLAHDIQVNLMPTCCPPLPADWQVAAFWQAATEVGGDFYDFIEVEPGQLGVVIADVSGKGMPAALYMVQTRSLLRAVAPGQLDPGVVLARLNQLLAPDTQGGMFVSLFYAIFDTHTGTLTYANAGHNPPLLVRANGQSERLRLHGLVLGVQPELNPTTGQNRLEPGDGVVFYTDGITEAHNAEDHLFGEARLAATLQAHWLAGLQEVIEKVRQAVNDFSATGHPTDDFTLVVLRRS